MALHRTQVAIAGGGMTGLALAVALRQAGREVMVLERQDKSQLPAEPQLRVSALNLATQRWLAELGVWSQLPAERCGTFHGMAVREKDSRALIEFSAATEGLPHLGSLWENAVVESALWQAAEAAGVQILSEVSWPEPPTDGERDISLPLDNGDIVLAQVLIAADGGESMLREAVGTPLRYWDYEQHGLVANIQTSEPHQGIARQLFLPEGPLALLPLADSHSCSIVWSQPPQAAQARMAASPAEFGRALTVAGDNWLGPLKLSSERASFPLRMRYARRWVTGRQVLLGDAAHTIHPLAGQGANLGFGDAHLLAQLLTSLGTLNGEWEPLALARQLRHYERARKAAATRHIAAMEGLHRLYTTQVPGLRPLRQLGLQWVNQVRPLKQFFLHQANQF